MAFFKSVPETYQVYDPKTKKVQRVFQKNKILEVKDEAEIRKYRADSKLIECDKSGNQLKVEAPKSKPVSYTLYKKK